MGRSAPTAAGETLVGWLPSRITGPVVVVAGPVVVGAALVVGPVVVVGPLVGAMLVVVTSVVVDAAVVVGAVVGPAVVDGAVTVGWVVVAARTEGAVVVVVPPTAAGAWAVAGPVVVVGLLTARRPGLSVVEGEGVVVGSRGAVVVVDADVGAGLVGIVGSATPGARRGGSGWGSRVAEATRAARTAVVSPKAKKGSRQGRRWAARCRGRRVGIVASSRFDSFFRLMGCLGTRAVRGHSWRSCAQGIERCIRCRRCSRLCWSGCRRCVKRGDRPTTASSYPREREAVFSQTETCLVLSLVNGSRLQPPQRSRSVIPASRAIRSSSDGQA